MRHQNNIFVIIVCFERSGCDRRRRLARGLRESGPGVCCKGGVSVLFLQMLLAAETAELLAAAGIAILSCAGKSEEREPAYLNSDCRGPFD